MIRITTTDPEGAVKQFGASKKFINDAIKAALRATTKDIERLLESSVALQMNLPRRIIARWRVKSKIKDTRTGFVWFGYNPIKAGYVAQMTSKSFGTAKQHDYGVDVRDYIFRGSFLARMSNGKGGVWQRKGIGRLPISEQKISILRAPGMAKEVSDKVDEIYKKNLAREIAKRLSI